MHPTSCPFETSLKRHKDGSIDYVVTAAFNIMKNGQLTGSHAFTIKKVTQDKVILINPWYPDNELTMNKRDFMGHATNVTLANTK